MVIEERSKGLVGHQAQFLPRTSTRATVWLTVPQSDPDPAPFSAPAATSPGCFPSTHWSVVLSAGDASVPGSALALDKLCRAYWRPIYAYVRRRGYAASDAEDLTQAFFEHFLERKL